MARTKVPDADLRAYLDAGHTQADAARYFGVSEAAIHQRLKRMRRLTSHVVALEKAGAVVDDQLSATARLRRIQQVIDEELDWVIGEARKEGADRRALVDAVLKLVGEVRQQLSLQHEITRTLIDLRVVKEFQETVLEVIGEESPETRRRIIERLKQRRALRATATLPPLHTSPERSPQILRLRQS